MRELFVVYIDIGAETPPENQRTLAENIRFAENLGAKVVATERKERGRSSGGVRARETHHAGGLRTLGDARLEAVSLSVRDSQILARCARRRRPHRDPGTELSHDATIAHILVVDDESQITRVSADFAFGHGYDIRVANDGETALEIMKDWTPDLVITDLAMPNMDGLELCRRIARRLPQVPIIVLSVRGEERTKVKALDAGADDYVTKPFSMNELLARVRANLRRGPAAEAGAAGRSKWAISASIWGAHGTRSRTARST